MESSIQSEVIIEATIIRADGTIEELGIITESNEEKEE
jgi:hypothetical protein